SVGLLISQGPAPVVVPEIIGMTWREARQALEAAGLGWDFDRNIDRQLAENFPDDATVTSSDPDPGANAHRGDVVTVRLGV
ncbi:MAG TPA: PASTA domain-containing protein, partial [Pseudolysinimonas sp.]|nr:PASTA domain-containing protein [Pseudolysinimonas sp.]